MFFLILYIFIYIFLEKYEFSHNRSRDILKAAVSKA